MLDNKSNFFILVADLRYLSDFRMLCSLYPGISWFTSIKTFVLVVENCNIQEFLNF